MVEYLTSQSSETDIDHWDAWVISTDVALEITKVCWPGVVIVVFKLWTVAKVETTFVADRKARCKKAVKCIYTVWSDCTYIAGPFSLQQSESLCGDILTEEVEKVPWSKKQFGGRWWYYSSAYNAYIRTNTCRNRCSRIMTWCVMVQFKPIHRLDSFESSVTGSNRSWPLL